MEYIMHEQQEDRGPQSSLETHGGAEDDVRDAIRVVNDTVRAGSFERYQRRKAENTVRTQKAHLALFETYLAEAGVPLKELFSHPASWSTITFGLVEEFVEWQLQKGYAMKSINERLSTVKRYAALACKAGGLATDELFLIREVKGFRRIEGQRVDAKRAVTRVGDKKAAPTFLTQEQLAQLFQLPDARTPQGCRDLVALHLLCDLGLRPGEAVSLVLADLDLERGILHVHRHKTGGEQYLLLGAEALAIVTCYLGMRRDRTPSSPLLVRTLKSEQLVELISQKDGLFSTPPLSTRSLFECVRKLGEAIGVEINAYDLRHQWTRDAIDSGNAVLDVLEAGGWAKDLPMIRRYVGERAIANERIHLHRNMDGCSSHL